MSCQGAISPIPLGCQTSSPFTNCSQSSSEYVIEENPVCDILPPNVLNSLPTLMANLPLTLLFIVTLPTRFFLCLIYNFYQFVVKGGATRLVNGIIADILNPVACFAQGVANGNTADLFAFSLGSFSPPDLSTQSVVPNTCSSNGILQGLCDLVYGIGYVLGFISTLINSLVDAFIVLICVLFNLTIEFGVCFGPVNFVICISASNVFNALGLKVNCALNCYCAIKNPPILKISNCPYSVCGKELCCSEYHDVSTTKVTCPSPSEYQDNGTPCVLYFNQQGNTCKSNSVCCPPTVYNQNGQTCITTYRPTPEGCQFNSNVCSSSLYYVSDGVPCQSGTCCPPTITYPTSSEQCVTVYVPSDGQCVPVSTECYQDENIQGNAPCNGNLCCPATYSDNDVVVNQAVPGQCVPITTLQNPK